MTDTIPITEKTGPAAPQTPGRGPRGRRRLMLLGGGAVGVLVVAGGAYLLLGSGSGTSVPNGPVAAPRAVPGVGTGATPRSSPVPSASTLPVTFTGTVGTDPFTPIYPPAAPSPSASAAPS
ncbi:MAG: hypothetical protein ACYCU5_08600, partial [Actinomycetes bacterium]